MTAPLLLTLLALAAARPERWTPVAEEEGVRVEWLDEEGARAQSFRADGVVDAAPAACLAVVRSDDFFSRTAPHVAEARIVSTEGERVRWFYARFSPPLVADRDYTIRVEEREQPSDDGPALRLEWRVENERGPAPRPGTVRVERGDGAWIFTPTAGDRTRVHYELVADPGGSIPGWIARRIQVASILAAFEELRRAAVPRR